MFKGASETNQRRASAISFASVPANFEELTPKQQHENLKLILWRVEEELLAEQSCKYRRAELGRRKFQLQEQMRALAPKIKGLSVDGFFVSVAKEKLAPALFRAIRDEAERLRHEETERRSRKE